MRKCDYCCYSREQIFYTSTALWCDKAKKFVHDLENDEREKCKKFKFYLICQNCKHFGIKTVNRKTCFYIDYCFKNEKETSENESCKFFEKNIDLLGKE